MKNLDKLSCEACTIDAPLVPVENYNELLKEISDWEIIYDEINKLSKTFTFKTYKNSVEFANKIAVLAEEEDHHPSILIEWGLVTVEWWSHKIKGLHLNDFICASKTDKLRNL